MYVSYHQDDWNIWLPLPEFSYNNADNSSTKASPFFTIYGENPSFDSTQSFEDTPSEKVSKKIQLVQHIIKDKLESARRQFRKYADRNRKVSPDFKPGEKVWLTSKKIELTRTTKKLS
ncbi:hypothetical protein O181_062635 [Austropuccinia psidii MF-1]|uniref:Uncharacterized protein n=1 Tax=Austropuccinia psidii MF-1 TaxID=1389203 RepID=A0A9Q3EPP9_9BASI|nr:hypothetical protein [Austropuccinia psidii MF-1]